MRDDSHALSGWRNALLHKLVVVLSDRVDASIRTAPSARWAASMFAIAANLPIRNTDHCLFFLSDPYLL